MSDCPFCGNSKPDKDVFCPHCNYYATSSWPDIDDNKLPLTLGPFVIQKNYFEYKNQKHNYQNIEHIDYDALVTRTFGPGRSIPLWDSEQTKITIHIKSNIVIKEKNTGYSSSLSTSQIPKLQNQRSVYAYLCRLSFNSRLHLYAKDINTQGYFCYDDTRFFTDGHIETRNQQKLSLQDWTIENYGSFVQFSPRNPSLLNKIGKGLSNLPTNSAIWKKRFHGNLTIHTTTDKDIFYSLMLRIYNIKFPFIGFPE